MKRFLSGQWMALVLVVAVLPLFCGCQGDGTVTFLDFVNTVLLGVTAAGSVAILRNI